MANRLSDSYDSDVTLPPSDSDVTLPPSDSDVTLPPSDYECPKASKDQENCNASDDLFEESDDGMNKIGRISKGSPKMYALPKRRSLIHNMSESDSDDDISSIKQNHASSHKPRPKDDKTLSPRDKTKKHVSEDKINYEIQRKGEKVISKNLESLKHIKNENPHSTKLNTDGKKRFINDFLNMSNSGSDSDMNEQPSSHRTKLSGSSTKQSRNNSKADTVQSKLDTNMSRPETKPYKTDKEYKQDYSRPFLSDVSKQRDNKSDKTTSNNHNSVKKESTNHYSVKKESTNHNSVKKESNNHNSVKKESTNHTSESKTTNKNLDTKISSNHNSNLNKNKGENKLDSPTIPSLFKKRHSTDNSESKTKKTDEKASINSPSHLAIKRTSSHSPATNIKRDSPSVPLKRKHSESRSPVPQELRKAVTEILSRDVNDNAKHTKKPPCKYGSKCYRKNPTHLAEFSHSAGDITPTFSTPPPSKKIKVTEGSSRSNSPSIRPSPSPGSSHSKQKPGTSSSLNKPETLTKGSPSSVQSSSKAVSMSPHSALGSNKVTVKPTQGSSKDKSRSPPRIPKNVKEKISLAEPYSFFFTKVTGVSDKYNSTYALDIKDILSPEMGELTASCQFNFMFDIPWLVKQYPPQFRSKPLLVVHGEQGPSNNALQAQAMTYTHIRFCQAKLEMMFGTHHTKMMLLLYTTGMRVVIHTANLIQNDWFQKTQGIWVSPVFPRLPSAGAEIGDSVTHFKRDLIQYITNYRAYQLKEWIEHIALHDMSAAKVFIIGSVPGRHVGPKVMNAWGHMKLRHVLQQHGPSQATVKTWPVIGQFSSIGSMGANQDGWLCGEWLQSLSATKMSAGVQSKARLQLIFPSKDNVRLSLEGFPAGGSIPYTFKAAKKQTWLHNFFHVWKSDGSGRSRAMPHIKTYIRPTQEGSKAAWFIVTSANLSKAAWGATEKKGAQLMIRSYEIGVLFLPSMFDEAEEVFSVTNDMEVAMTTGKMLIPYNLPTTMYDKKDRPWMWDIPYMDLPDTNGNMWCPFSK